MLLPYATLTMVKLALATSIVGAGVVVPSVIPLTYFTETSKQHPFGTVITALLDTLSNSSTAVGVEIAKLEGLVSPFTEIATAMGVTVAPSGSARLAPKFS
jgi:hypothetical protein